MSLAVRALSKSASHLLTAVFVADVSTLRSAMVSVMEALQVVGCWRFGAQSEWAQYVTGQTHAQGRATAETVVRSPPWVTSYLTAGDALCPPWPGAATYALRPRAGPAWTALAWAPVRAGAARKLPASTAIPIAPASGISIATRRLKRSAALPMSAGPMIEPA